MPMLAAAVAATIGDVLRGVMLVAFLAGVAVLLLVAYRELLALHYRRLDVVRRAVAREDRRRLHVVRRGLAERP